MRRSIARLLVIILVLAAVGPLSVAALAETVPVQIFVRPGASTTGFAGAGINPIKGEVYAVLKASADLYLLDLDAWTGSLWFDADEMGTEIDVSADGLTMYMTGGEEGSSVFVFDIDTHTFETYYALHDQFGSESASATDVEETTAGVLFVTPRAPGYVVRVDRNNSDEMTRVASETIFQLATSMAYAGTDELYVGTATSPEVVYKLDLTTPGADLVDQTNIAGLTGVDQMALSPDGSILVLASGESIDTSTMESGDMFPAGIPRFSADGSLLYVASVNAQGRTSIEVIDTTDRTTVTTFEGGCDIAAGKLEDFETLPDGRFVAVGRSSTDQSIACRLTPGGTSPVFQCDFNGDELGDIPIGVPGEDITTIAAAGGMNMLLGDNTPTGIATSGHQFWSQDSEGIKGAAETGDLFGYVTACADFDSDGFDDVVVGVPLEDVGSIVDAGSVHVLYGGSTGLTNRDMSIHQDSPGAAGTAEAGDVFGAALSTGDFNGDGYPDLAVGVVEEDIGGISNAGAIQIFYGSGSGLTMTDAILHQDGDGVAGTGEVDDFFGDDLARGDLNGDGFTDLVVGIPGEDGAGLDNSGRIHLFWGASGGLSGAADRSIDQDSVLSGNDVPGNREGSDFFGSAVATGDIDSDGFDDLAVGIPGEEPFGTPADVNQGSVLILRGGGGGLSPWSTWSQETAGIQGSPEAGDFFGLSVLLDDFDGDTFFDLVVGVPFEDVGTKVDAGSINVIYGTASGLTAAGDDLKTADRLEHEGAFYGRFLFSTNVNGDAYGDLVVSAVDQGSGYVEVLLGNLSLNHGGRFSQNSPGVPGTDEAGDYFGYLGGSV